MVIRAVGFVVGVMAATAGFLFDPVAAFLSGIGVAVVLVSLFIDDGS